VPNGFDRDELEKTPEFSFREKYGIKKNTKMFLNVSNITGAKGHTRAMLTYLLSFIPNSVMVFNGIPMHPKSKHLITLAKLVNRFSFGWKRILFVEYHHPTTLHMMKEADVFLFFSNIEYSPLVLFEAAAAGLPFLASDCGNSKEIAEWTGIGQIVETVKTPNGFSNVSIKDAVKKLRALVAMKQKPVTAPDYVDNYNWDALFKKYEDVVQKVIGQ
jgi:glycosyltransferase involved in cell wall biosynthesis